MADQLWVDSLADRAGARLQAVSPAAASLWAKSGDGIAWLNLPQHLVDSACVGACLWEYWLAPQTKNYLANMLQLSAAETGRVVAWLAGTHDLGKATSVFQRKLEKRVGMEAFSARLADAGLTLAYGPATANLTSVPHSVLSRVIVRRWMNDRRIKRRIAHSLSQVSEAHHGRPSAPPINDAAIDIIDECDAGWRSVHEELADLIADVTEVLPILRSLKRIAAAPELQLLTGLVIMADWIASNESAFPLGRPHDQLARVEAGLGAIALTGPWCPNLAADADVDGLYRCDFSWPPEFSVRPIQQEAALAAQQSPGPTLMVIEAPTGEGKTEAGLVAGYVLAARSGAQGLVLAAPTMSTANGLFRRTAAWVQAVTPTNAISSMFLAHSKSILSRDFRRLRFRQIGETEEGSAGAVVATSWLSGTKRGLLSNFVVGTVDQILMLALQMKHSMLRHVGLAGKVIIIDEVHSYDVFMGEYLATALSWLARYQVSVILMSATLPLSQKNKLVSAYASQLTNDTVVAASQGYPLVTTVSAGGVSERPVALGPTQAHVRLMLIDDHINALADLLTERLADGGIALVICNTVRRAQSAYVRLNEIFPNDVELHHAAFMANQRVAKEDTLRLQLGPDAHRGAGRPDRRIVVSTQVAEQSLDIDVDLLVTDIVPMDMLVQRIGRLHRHSRPAADRPEHVRTPMTFIRGIEQIDPLPVWDSGTAYIYDPMLLLSTLVVLREHYLDGGFRRPDDIAPAVHAAYADDPAIPSEWRKEWARAVHDSEVAADMQSSRARSFRIPEPQFASVLADLFDRYIDSSDRATTGDEAGYAQVRDAVPAIEVIPIIANGDGYWLWGEGEQALRGDDDIPDNRTAFELASSTVRLPARFSKEDWQFEKTINQLEQETPLGWQDHYLLRGQVALKLDVQGECLLAGQRLRYSDDLGLEQLFEPAARVVQGGC